jgi:hypothetical protein
MPYRVAGIAGPLYTPEEMTIPRLSHNGECVEGWVIVPTDKAWRPQDGDLLWRPPTATKSTDIDRAGSIVDVGPWTPGEDMAWVTAELAKREKYLDYIRSKVRSGAIRLTSFLAKFLGMDFDDGVELAPRQPFSGGPVAAMKAAADLERMISRTGPDEARVRAIAAAAAMTYAETGKKCQPAGKAKGRLVESRPFPWVRAE